MTRICSPCGQTYDDAACSTICPHALLMSRAELAQKDAGIKLLGRTVTFAHLPAGPRMRVWAVNWEGLCSLEGFAGEFAPHALRPVTP